MLSDEERRVLHDIERNTRRRDAAFADRMRAGSCGRPFPVAAVACASLYIVLPMVAFLFGLIAVLVTAHLAAALVAGTLLRRRRASRRNGLPDPRAGR